MNAENREAPADVAAPDMLSRQWKSGSTGTIVCESNFTKRVTSDKRDT